MKRLFAGLALALCAAFAGAATLAPVQLLNPTGSAAGQAIISAGASSAPAWGVVGVAGGGTGSAAGGVGLDNLYGFSGASTGYVGRVSSGVYSLTSVIPINSGGTNATTASAALTNLGAAPVASPTFTGTVTAPVLKATGSAKVIAVNTAGGSVANNTTVTVTGWTAQLNQGSAFVPSTGVFTAPTAAQYLVNAQFQFATSTFPSGGIINAQIWRNGAIIYQSAVVFPSAAASQPYYTHPINAVVNCAAGDTITVVLAQTSGAALTLTTTAASNYLMITQLP
jgi:hypothetical protein